jgi:hypothetical protein
MQILSAPFRGDVDIVGDLWRAVRGRRESPDQHETHVMLL